MTLKYKKNILVCQGDTCRFTAGDCQIHGGKADLAGKRPPRGGGVIGHKKNDAPILTLTGMSGILPRMANYLNSLMGYIPDKRLIVSNTWNSLHFLSRRLNRRKAFITE